MTEYRIHPDAHPFFYKRCEIGALLIHGFTSSPFEMKRLGDFLASKNISVICPRLAGHGTHPADLENRTISEWHDDVKGAYQELKSCAKEIFAVGSSMGGNLVFELAQNHPLKGAVLLGTPVFIRNHFLIETLLPYLGPIIRFYKKPGTIGRFKRGQTVLGKNCSYSYIPTRALGELLRFIRRQKNIVLAH